MRFLIQSPPPSLSHRDVIPWTCLHPRLFNGMYMRWTRGTWAVGDGTAWAGVFVGVVAALASCLDFVLSAL